MFKKVCLRRRNFINFTEKKRFDCKRCRSQPNIAIIAGKRNVAVQIRAAFGHTARQHAMYHERAEQNGNVKHRADACQRFSDVAGRISERWNFPFGQSRNRLKNKNMQNKGLREVIVLPPFSFYPNFSAPFAFMFEVIADSAKHAVCAVGFLRMAYFPPVPD